MRSTHSQNNSGRPLLAAGLTVCTHHAALNATGDVLQSRMEKKNSEPWVREGEAPGGVIKIRLQRVSRRGEPSERAQQEDELLQVSLVSAVNRR